MRVLVLDIYSNDETVGLQTDYNEELREVKEYIDLAGLDFATQELYIYREKRHVHEEILSGTERSFEYIISEKNEIEFRSSISAGTLRKYHIFPFFALMNRIGIRNISIGLTSKASLSLSLMIYARKEKWLKRLAKRVEIEECTPSATPGEIICEVVGIGAIAELPFSYILLV